MSCDDRRVLILSACYSTASIQCTQILFVWNWLVCDSDEPALKSALTPHRHGRQSKRVELSDGSNFIAILKSKATTAPIYYVYMYQLGGSSREVCII